MKHVNKLLLFIIVVSLVGILLLLRRSSKQTKKKPPIINALLSWDNLPTYLGHTHASVQQAFYKQKATKVLLPKDYKLYKFSSFATLAPPGKKELSPWWASYDSYEHEPGLGARLNLAQHLGVSAKELTRVLSAVKEHWSSLAYTLVIKLKQPTYAFFGDIAGMDRIDENASSMRTPTEARGSASKLTGHGTQFYIPFLCLEEVALVEVKKLP